MINKDYIINQISETLIRASICFRADKIMAYQMAIEKEMEPKAKWALETILENALIAGKNHSPLCDDTGIPHLFLEIGPRKILSGDIIELIHLGIADGLRRLPGRPMAIDGNDSQRIDQSGGLNSDPSALLPAPLLIKRIEEDVIRLHILMLGGGPAIRGKTCRVFHQHKVSVVVDEIVKWSVDSVGKLGCTPCTLCIGIGRSQFEASALMMEAMVYGKYDEQNDLEQEITRRVNKSNIGALGLKGSTTVLKSFIKVGHQRASGVRIVSMRPCCCFEPRSANIEIDFLEIKYCEFNRDRKIMNKASDRKQL
jgi:fumarate hydratase subunit alpha